MRRPGCIAQALALKKFEQARERARMLIDCRVYVAEPLEARGHRGQSKVGWIGVSDLLPGQRRRDTRVGRWPHRVRRGDGAIFGVLVVVHEYTLAFLLPPLAGSELRRAPLDFARQREGAATHLVEAPAPLESHIDVHAART